MLTCVTGKPMSLYTASSEGTQSVWHCLLCTYFPLPQSPMNTSHSQGLCVTVSQEQMFQRCKFPVHLKKAGEKGERYNFRKVSSGIHTLLGARESSFPSECVSVDCTSAGRFLWEQAGLLRSGVHRSACLTETALLPVWDSYKYDH